MVRPIIASLEGPYFCCPFLEGKRRIARKSHAQSGGNKGEGKSISFSLMWVLLDH